MGDVLAVLPFQNTLSTFNIPGSGIVAALENGVSQVEEGAGRFPQVSGLRFSWDPKAPADEPDQVRRGARGRRLGAARPGQGLCGRQQQLHARRRRRLRLAARRGDQRLRLRPRPRGRARRLPRRAPGLRPGHRAADHPGRSERASAAVQVAERVGAADARRAPPSSDDGAAQPVGAARRNELLARRLRSSGCAHPVERLHRRRYRAAAPSGAAAAAGQLTVPSVFGRQTTSPRAGGAAASAPPSPASPTSMRASRHRIAAHRCLQVAGTLPREYALRYAEDGPMIRSRWPASRRGPGAVRTRTKGDIDGHRQARLVIRHACRAGADRRAARRVRRARLQKGLGGGDPRRARRPARRRQAARASPTRSARRSPTPAGSATSSAATPPPPRPRARTSSPRSSAATPPAS